MRTALHVVNSVNPELGGTSVSVVSLARASAVTGRYTSVLLHGDSSNRFPVSSSNLEAAGADFSYLNCVSNFISGGEIENRIGQADIVHIHGLWQTSCIASGLLARRHKKPVIISAHGMLDSWALHNKAWKKWPYSLLFERPNLRRATLLRALTHSEAIDYRHFGLSNPILILPNGVDPLPSVGPELALEQWPVIRDKRVVLFLSRVHHKKGLDLLARAWSNIAATFPDAHLVIAGPDSEGTLALIKRILDNSSLRNRVTFTGSVFGNLKQSLLGSATVFVLPSYSEGFPIAALESLACGVPIIITDACHMNEVREIGAGWVISPKLIDLIDALREALSCPAQHLRSMGKRGCHLIQTKYRWEHIGVQMAEALDWVLGGDRPRSVEILD
jgi:glycosyltransferase involved in cell wall biosynthesis